MSITIPRFEKKTLKTKGDNNRPINFKGNTGVLIKDHKIDEIIGYIQLCTIQDKNIELADRIITVIEEFIENEQNQH